MLAVLRRNNHRTAILLPRLFVISNSTANLHQRKAPRARRKLSSHIEAGVKRMVLGAKGDRSSVGTVKTLTISKALSGDGNSMSGESVDTQQLKKQLSELCILVQAQQLALQDQQSVIEDLRSQLIATPPIRALPYNAPMFDTQIPSVIDRRNFGGATPKDYRVLPDRIILVRHAESEGNVDNIAYTYIPDPQVPLTDKGKQQAREAGLKIKRILEASGTKDYKLFFYTSPYRRSLQTFEGISQAVPLATVVGAQEEVQLREQDFGNFQDGEGKKREKAERLRFGRFFYRFPNGESGADVYDRITIFEDHMIRDINAGRFGANTSLVLVTHGLALRIFLMRWFHWTVDQFLGVYNPPNAEPLVLERIASEQDARPGGPLAWVHTKALYRLTDESMAVLKGCTTDMCMTSVLPRGVRYDAAGNLAGGYPQGPVGYSQPPTGYAQGQPGTFAPRVGPSSVAASTNGFSS